MIFKSLYLIILVVSVIKLHENFLPVNVITVKSEIEIEIDKF